MKIEQRSIDFVPESERHGKPSSQFNIWFCSQATVLSLVTGGFAIQLGANVFWGIVAIVLGHSIGGIIMASHANQGPKLGIPQMIQSRAQFGFAGAVFPIICVVAMYIFYFSSTGILGGQSLHSTFPSVSTNGWIIILAIITAVINFLGHDWIHSLNKYLSILLGIVFTFATFLVFQIDLPEGSWSPSNFKLTPFLFIFSMTAVWQLQTAPYVADYSRYLPRATSSPKIFWYTYAGTVGGAIWVSIIGLLLAAATPNFLDNPIKNLVDIFNPSLRTFIFIILFLGIIGLNVLNLYGAIMSTITIVASIKNLREVSIQSRTLILILVTITATFLSTWGETRFNAIYTDGVVILGYLLLPWSAINLVDFYFVRKGNYIISEIFNVDGIYGRFNWITIFVFLVSIMAEIPFMYLSFYHGAVATILEGADLSWVIGSILPGILYFVLMKRKIEWKQNTDQVIEPT